MEFDYHVHSNYSDGFLLPVMVRTAQEAGLSGVGFADHCTVSDRPQSERFKRMFGFNLDVTYERRREGIEHVREEADVEVYDAVEMDYDPRDEHRIAAFLDDAGFDYALGSVHAVDGRNVQRDSEFADDTEGERRAVVDAYYDNLVDLIDSELFEVAAHVDLLERTEPLRGYATAEQYERVADAFERSRTIPELNAGRVLRDYGEFHPAPTFLDVLHDRDIPVTLGTDSHSPGQFDRRVEHVRAYLGDADWEPATLDL